MHEKSAGYHCQLCGKVFSCKSYVKTHVCEKKTDSQQWKDIQCDKCDKTFSDRGGLRKHCIAIHKNHCEKCDKSYPHLTAEHVCINNQGGKQTEKHQCIMCDNDFDSVALLNKHFSDVHCSIEIALQNEHQ